MSGALPRFRRVVPQFAVSPSTTTRMTTDDFRARLLQHAKVVVDRAPRATSEAATSQFLVLPFFSLLGYDPLNPDEIIPEAHASFSDKFKNRVDYAICLGGEPAIGVECKKVGALNEGHRGELKGYFNAVPSIKLGILTDGVIWQLYSDTVRDNMLDDDPFVTLDLREVATGALADHQLDALQRLRREVFDPRNVGADARRKLHVASYLAVLERMFAQPDEAMVRTLMAAAGIDGRRTGRMIEEHAPVVHEAMQAFLDRKILARVGFAERADLVRVAPEGVSTVTTVADDTTAAVTIPSAGDSVRLDDGIITTETERAVFEYVIRRLPFLIDRDEALYQKLTNLYPRDYKTRFTVCYKQDRNGRLFNFQELSQEPRYRFEFPDTGAVVQTSTLGDIDQELLTAYMKRVAELG